MEGSQQSGDRFDLVGALRQRAWLVIVCAVVVAGLAYVLSNSQQPRYEASALLTLIIDQAPTLEAPPNPDARPIVVTRELTTRAARRAHLPLAHTSVTAKQLAKSNIVQITTSAPQARLAASLANAYAQEFRAGRRDRQRAVLRKTLDSTKRTLRGIPKRPGDIRRATLGQRIDDLKTQLALNTGGLEMTERAVPPAQPVSPKPRRDAALGGLFGLVLGAALALLWAQADRRMRQVSQLQDISGLPVLGTIPRSSALRGRSPAILPPGDAEAFRIVQANTRFFDPELDLRSIIVTSASPGEGKTTLAWNLAVAAASGGLRVLLIEADLRRPSLVERHGLEENGGLVELLSEDRQIADLVQHVPIASEGNGHGPSLGMEVLTAGRKPTNPAGLIASERMRAIIARAEIENDLVVLDAPPVSVVSDAIPLLRQVGGVIVVSYLGRSTRSGLDGLLTQLRHLDVRVLGVVANGSTQRGAGYPYYQYQ